MNEPHLLLFDDEVARGWEPFSTTRPVGELLYGTGLLRERAERFWGLECRGHLAGRELASFREEGAPPVLPLDMEHDGEGAPLRVVLLSRCAPDLPSGREPPGATLLRDVGDAPVRLRSGDETVGWILPPGSFLPPPDLLLDPSGGEGPPFDGSRGEVELAAEVLGAVWDLMSRNPHRIHRDLAGAGVSGDGTAEPASGDFPSHVIRMGEHPILVDPGSVIEPGTVLDARSGPIRIEDGARVGAGTVLAGPAWIGQETSLLGGPIRGVSIGPVCKVRGEVDSTVLLGYSNKAHDGYLGHAYLGRWVNLGAMTTNSDLKNNYGPVRLRFPEGPTDTGLLKVGCFLGDHVKTGIGTLLNTGTVVGAGSNLFGGAMPPPWVPPFSWGQGTELVAYDPDRFIETTRMVMGRRGLALDAGTEQLLRSVWRDAWGSDDQSDPGPGGGE